jgi:hypothetical protein
MRTYFSPDGVERQRNTGQVQKMLYARHGRDLMG